MKQWFRKLVLSIIVTEVSTYFTEYSTHVALWQTKLSEKMKNSYVHETTKFSYSIITDKTTHTHIHRECERDSHTHTCTEIQTHTFIQTHI